MNNLIQTYYTCISRRVENNEETSNDQLYISYFRFHQQFKLAVNSYLLSFLIKNT